MNATLRRHLAAALMAAPLAALPAFAVAQTKADAAADARKAQAATPATPRQAVVPPAKPTALTPRAAESKAVQPASSRVPGAGKGDDEGCGGHHAMKDSDA